MSTSPALEQTHTLPNVARRLGISVRTLYREIADGNFPRPVKIRTASRVLESDVLAYLAKFKRERDGVTPP